MVWLAREIAHRPLVYPKAEITSAKKWYAPGMSVPVAVDKSNKNAPITGLVQDELIPGNLTGTSSLLGINYTMAAGAEGSASLTIQLKPESTPIVIDKSMWTFTAGAGTQSTQVSEIRLFP